jgi:flagellar assembly factor FliW
MSTKPQSDRSVIRLTTQFGDFEAAAGNIVTFPEGLPGFEGCRRFIILRQTLSPLLCLSAVDGPPVTFLAIDPRRVLRRYRCALREPDRFRLAAGPKTALLWLTIITIASDDEMYVNLRAPIVINPERLTGVQVMPQGALYPLRQRLDLEELALTGTDGPG